MLNLEKKVSLYSVMVLLFIGIIGSVLFAASVRHVILAPESRMGAFGNGLLMVAEFPALVRDLIKGDRGQEISDSRFSTLDGFKKQGKLPAGVLADDGYLLLSSYDVNQAQATVQLIQNNTQKTLHEWAPDIEALNNLNILSEEYSHDYITQSNFGIIHPLPTAQGNLVFNNSSSL